MQDIQQTGRTGEGAAMEPPMALALAANFGSVERWRDEFMAMGRAFGAEPGGVRLVFQPRDGTLVNQRGGDPMQGASGGVPILSFDVVDAFMRNVAWAAVYARYQAAVYAATESIGATADEAAAAVVVDVRRAGVFAQAATMLPGARWLDPAGVAGWAAELPSDREVLVYCVYGHEVGRSTALRLRAAGLNARYLRGGIDGWQTAGRPVVPIMPLPSP